MKAYSERSPENCVEPSLGGLDSAICELCSVSRPAPVLRLGVPHSYVSSGPYGYLMAYSEPDQASLAARIASFVGK